MFELNENLISIILPTLAGGGAERAMLYIARGLKELGFHVHLILGNEEGPYKKLVPTGVQIINFKSKKLLYTLPKLISYYRSEKPLALISALSHTNIIAIIGKLIARSKTNLVITEHNNLTRTTKEASSFKAKILPFLIRLFYGYADYIVAVSKGVANDLVTRAGISQKKLSVIYNPVIVPDIFRMAEEPIEHPWFNASGPPIILGIGRLTKQKDFATLIKAYAFLRNDIPTKLVILGEGEERSNLEKLVRELGVQEEVYFLGFVENPYKFIKKSSIFVLSSRWEGMALVLIEAIALGKPVVATNCPFGPAEILENGRLGVLVPVENPQAIYNEIKNILGNNNKMTNVHVTELMKKFGYIEVTKSYINLIMGKKSDK